jgi:hypothetical protein
MKEKQGIRGKVGILAPKREDLEAYCDNAMHRAIDEHI